MPTEYDVRVRCIECGADTSADWITRVAGGSACQWPFIRISETALAYAAREAAWMQAHPLAVAQGFPYLGADEWQAARRAAHPWKRPRP